MNGYSLFGVSVVIQRFNDNICNALFKLSIIHFQNAEEMSFSGKQV